MKNWIRIELFVLLFALAAASFNSCKEQKSENNDELALSKEITDKTPGKQLSKEFKSYWYAGDAEVTSYKLEQARYGEIREGHAVLIYVTEPFLADKQVKADQSNPQNIPVLKLNSTKKYLTGIYPYSIMSSTFYPVYDNQHAIKVTNSVQEWCGHVYAQINNRDKFEILSYSYFESEADQNIKVDKTILENELWNKIRIDPANLPTGDLQLIPSLEYIRLGHKEIKAYAAKAELIDEEDTYSYELHYPELERSLKITINKEFPFAIEGWSESFKSGFGDNAKTLTSTATKNKVLKTPYWKQNGNKDVFLRDSLGI